MASVVHTLTAAAIILMALSNLAAAQEPAPGFDLDAAREIGAAIDRDPQIAQAYQACPADIYKSQSNYLNSLFPNEDVADQECERNPKACFSKCTTSSSGEHCLHLGLAFEDHEDDLKSRHWEMLYSFACALGASSGCTNRAAGIRNGDYDDDPLKDATAQTKNLCQFRSFSLACADNDSWGCAMLGQAHQMGEGTARDYVSARYYYRKACKDAEDFAACTFAKEKIDAMNAE